MEYIIETDLNAIAKKALAGSVVRLDVEKPITYPDYVSAFDVEKTVPYAGIKSSENRIRHRLPLFEMSGGSGFFITERLIVTNFHVAVGAYSILAKFAGSGGEFPIEGVEAFDIRNDLVLLRVGCEGIPLRLGDSDSVADDDAICAVGYPDGFANITHGTVHGTPCCCDQIQMKINTSVGSSGCPVMNGVGEVIGVDVSGDDVYSYAIPANQLRRLVESKGKAFTLKSWHKHPYVRAFIETKEGDMKRQIGLYEDAVIHYNLAIDLNPVFVKAFAGRAEAKFGVRAFDEGFGDILRVLRLNRVPFGISSVGAYFSWRRNIFQISVVRFFMGLYRKVF
ncbi:hypothetical protein C6497_15920 [Candidatus Poribacteria bacterium]|nr:MAG: hypothetical protein C6497_15920 [Candidatus Poribacteria bacterium]